MITKQLETASCSPLFLPGTLDSHGMSAKLDNRADRIMKALLRAENISVQELVDQIGTSAPSIRRDLAQAGKTWSCAAHPRRRRAC